MPVVISEFEVVPTEPEEEREVEESPGSDRRTADRLAPRDVVRILEREERRRLRVRAH